jgi:hypothetical protein
LVDSIKMDHTERIGWYGLHPSGLWYRKVVDPHGHGTKSMFHKMFGSLWAALQLAASQEGLFSPSR